MAAHGIDLRNECNAQPGIGLGKRNGRTQPRPARTYDRYICFYCFHRPFFEVPVAEAATMRLQIVAILIFIKSLAKSVRREFSIEYPKMDSVAASH
jgi:hypothetical protein